jgi:intraflagellar transport protein 80
MLAACVLQQAWATFCCQLNPLPCPQVKSIPSEEGRAAALAVYRRQPAEAESLLLGAGLVYRAIKLNVKLFRWQRALELAQKHRQHVDTVLLYRSRWVGR